MEEMLVQPFPSKDKNNARNSQREAPWLLGLGDVTFGITKAGSLMDNDTCCHWHALGFRNMANNLIVIAFLSFFKMTYEYISYTVIAHVIDSWVELRRQKDFEERAGSILFQHLFVKCPSAKVLFGFPIDMEPHSDELLKSKRFLTHARYLISMIDTALNMLGPDFDLLKEIMAELGKKHVRYGVKPEFFPLMGEALIETLNETLTDKIMTAAVQESWRNVYNMLSSNMVKAMV